MAKDKNKHDLEEQFLDDPENIFDEEDDEPTAEAVEADENTALRTEVAELKDRLLRSLAASVRWACSSARRTNASPSRVKIAASSVGCHASKASRPPGDAASATASAPSEARATTSTSSIGSSRLARPSR